LAKSIEMLKQAVDNGGEPFEAVTRMLKEELATKGLERQSRNSEYLPHQPSN
jgi:hypothetical protein